MEVKSCKRCGRLFQYVTGKTVCPDCKQKEELLFEKVKDYLREHPGAIIKEVSEETGASVPMIESFLKAGRLQVAEDSPLSILCEKCGAKIKTGRFCQKCTHDIATQIQGEARDMRQDQASKLNIPKEKERMRFLDSQRIQKR
jgi:flagellar operon protein (TIGR03826 family)